MQDDVVIQMTRGIDESACIIVFVTKAYIDKVNSGNDADNCFKEFMYDLKSWIECFFRLCSKDILPYRRNSDKCGSQAQTIHQGYRS